MLDISPQFCSMGWLLEEEDPMFNHDQENGLNYLSRERPETSAGSIDLHSPCKNGEFNNEGFHEGDDHESNNKMAKKLNHNASERDRRKRMNSLYSSLRSLLPPEDQTRKLSIPATVSRVVKYIPELQREVERLTEKKEKLMMSKKICRQEKYTSMKKQQRHRKATQSSAITQISDREIIVQSSAEKGNYSSFCEAVMRLEVQEGFLLLNASSFQSLDATTLFYTLHLQAQENQVIDTEMLKEKVWPFHEKGEEITLT
ncbi:transcription factor ORG2 [Sesamum indicum]|uniref:Transcription factor ORG2 n=1 Tax=Sesamum indicum TaxID=4182 RepID=A0A6I9SYZ8_SESIN|nr:transcription factor ORG2 [Sesamum indicum]